MSEIDTVELFDILDSEEADNEAMARFEEQFDLIDAMIGE